MILIRTAEALARAIETPPDENLRRLLAERAESLAAYSEYDLSELAEILVVQAGDQLTDVEQAYGQALVGGGCFAFLVETIVLRTGWYEATWIQSDDGFALVLIVQDDRRTDANIAAACRFALEQASPFDT